MVKAGDKSYTLNTIDRPAVYVYNGENITSPTNKAQPKEGDPCHTLDQDSRNYVVFEPRSQDGVPRVGNQNISPTLNTGGGGQRQPCILQQDIHT